MDSAKVAVKAQEVLAKALEKDADIYASLELSKDKEEVFDESMPHAMHDVASKMQVEEEDPSKITFE